MPQYSYYDIDTILAEEELVPCRTLLHCRHLAHLDPDYLTHATVQPQDDEDDGHDYSADAAGRRRRGGKSASGGKTAKRSRSSASASGVARHLPEGSRIKMPLWSVDRWSNLGFVRLGLPRHFGRNAREGLQADPSVADLRSKNERFYLSGHLLIDLIERSASAKKKSSTTSGRRSTAGGGQPDAATAALVRDASALRRTLVVTYAGERMRRVLDWTLSSIDDDVSAFTDRLTALETRLFRRGASAAAAHAAWKIGGSRRIAVSGMALRSAAMGQRAALLAAAGGGGQTAAAPEEERDGGGRTRAVTPDGIGGRGGGGGGKRTRVA